MFDYWRETRDIKKRIRSIQERSRRRAEVETVQMIGIAVANDRFEIERLETYLRKLDTERWLKYAAKHDVAILPFEEYWDVEGGVDGTPTESYLTEKGKKSVRVAVSEKRAVFGKRWSPTVSIVISVLSFLIAVISLIVAIVALSKS
jgi:hypothetical protein